MYQQKACRDTAGCFGGCLRYHSAEYDFSLMACTPCTFECVMHFLISELSTPGGWDEVIDKELRLYEPRDREAWKTLRTAVLPREAGTCRCQVMVEAERKANTGLLNAPETALGYGFVRRDVSDE
jgi:hypothetical protein